MWETPVTFFQLMESNNPNTSDVSVSISVFGDI